MCYIDMRACLGRYLQEEYVVLLSKLGIFLRENFVVFALHVVFVFNLNEDRFRVTVSA
jgi:hypothetical protein